MGQVLSFAHHVDSATMTAFEAAMDKMPAILSDIAITLLVFTGGLLYMWKIFSGSTSFGGAAEEMRVPSAVIAFLSVLFWHEVPQSSLAQLSDPIKVSFFVVKAVVATSWFFLGLGLLTWVRDLVSPPPPPSCFGFPVFGSLP